MMSIRAFGDDTLYVSFPMSNKTGTYQVPPDVDEWLRDHNINDWSSIMESQPGVFLAGADAVAFKLKFRL